MEKKTECEIVQDLLLGYVDNTLNVESKKLVEKHLSECDKCKESLQEILKDDKENETQQNEIDYLKKVRMKTKLKSIVIVFAILAIGILCFYTNKFIKINSIMNKGSKMLESQNYYCETQELLGNSETMVTRMYYKDGKYKRTHELYSDEGIKKYNTQYGNVNSDEIIEINEEDKTLNIRKDEFAKLYNKESSIKWDVFQIEERKSLYLNLGKTLLMDIHVENYGSNKEYYVLKNQFKDTDKSEIHIDKETGLVIKQIGKEVEKRTYPLTDIVLQINDRIITYKHEFNIVQNEDVEMPNLDNYSVTDIEKQ